MKKVLYFSVVVSLVWGLVIQTYRLRQLHEEFAQVQRELRQTERWEYTERYELKRLGVVITSPFECILTTPPPPKK
jgi:hypothetical protein